MDEKRPVSIFSRVTGFFRGNGGVVSVAIATGAFLVASGTMPFVGGGKTSDGVPISWEQGVSSGDPHVLDDGFEHYVVTFAGLGERGAVETQEGYGAPVSQAASSTTAPTSEVKTNKKIRLVPLPTNAAGEIAPGDIEALAKEGTLLRIVSDGTTIYGELEVTGESATVDHLVVTTTTTTAKVVKPDAGEGDLGTQELVDGDPLAALLKKVPGTKKVTLVMPGTYAVVTTAKAAAFESLPGVADVDEDIVLTVSTNDPQYNSQWGLNNTGQLISNKAGTPGADIGVEDAWAVSQGTGQVVAVVDTGIEVTHPDLADAIWKNPGEICGNGKDDEANGFVDDCNGYDFANNDGTVFDPTSDNRHATHIAGIIAARTNNSVGVAGIAPAAKIMSVKVGNTGSFRLSDGARGIAYAAANGAAVINCSFGTPAGTPYDAVSSMGAAIESARAKGVLVVVAAGNDSRNIDSSPTYPASFPHDNLVSVGSSTNTDSQSSFSNYGSVSVDLHAPGSDILSTLPGATYGGMSGTSMASPMAAGAAALIRSVLPSLTPIEVRALMMSGSTPLASLSGRSVSGQRLDVGRILNSASTPSTEPVRFSFDGFAGMSEQVDMDGAIKATVNASQVPAGANVGVRATLVTAVDGAMYGVVAAPIRLAGAEAQTDDQASVALSPTGGFSPGQATRSLPFGLTLSAGEYVLVAEAYSTIDDQTIGRPWSVFFTVAAKNQTAPPPVVAPVPLPGVGGGGGGGTPAPAPAPAPAPTGTGGGNKLAPTPSPGGGTPVPSPAPAPSPNPPPVPSGGEGTPVPSPAPDLGPQLPPLPPPVTSGSLTINSLSPRYGAITGGEVVMISGRGFRPTLYVRFGTRSARVIAMSSTQIAVVTPSHITGISDLTVAVSGGDSVTMPNAYTFFDNTSPSPGGTSPSPGGGSPAPSPTPPPVSGGSPAPAPAPAPPGGPGDAGGSPQVQLPDVLPTRFTFGDAIDGPGKTRLRPVVGFSPLSRNTPTIWPAQVCRMTSCQGTRL